MDITKIKGIGPKTVDLLKKISIENVEDLITYYPYRYNIISPTNFKDIIEDENVVLNVVIATEPKVSYIRKNLNKMSFMGDTNNNFINITIFNRAYLVKHLTRGKSITVIGKYDKKKNIFTASDIKLFTINKTLVEPVYHTISGLKSSSLIKMIQNGLESTQINEIIPEYLNERYNFISRDNSVRQIHHPTDLALLKKAKLKLIYEELFDFMFKINILKLKKEIMDNYVIKHIDESVCEDIIKKLPFELTNDQMQAIKEIVSDYNAPRRMNRLILGDVGSGKTIVSFLAIILNFMCGYQSALLAPTEVLAKQHFDNIKYYSDIYGFKVGLLVGSMTKKEKEKVYQELFNNEIDVIIGTHAILEDDVIFNNIGLVVTDEQHRFGVNQRKSLQNKGDFVDVLYMSATPIPRTYALAIYGDMDISMIKQKPSGRKEILTKAYKQKDLPKIAELIEKEIDELHQVYIVAPLIEENDTSNLNDINKIHESIRELLKKDVTIDILHGKMKQADKNRIMQDFKDGKTKVLISTTVIEVGVDVKNATMMVIFNAERFGLATLHQLRGRVGRNSLASKCILISDYNSERLKVLEESNDGFYISECDFKLRGSGDLFGVRQSGDMNFKIADLQRDYKILLQCKKDSSEYIDNNVENGFRESTHYSNIVNELLK